MIYDNLIIGTGIAGLSCAINLPKNSKTLIVCRGIASESNSYLAQGGLAAPISDDDVYVHIQDTLNVGCGLNNKDAVELLCKNGARLTSDLIARKMQFDKDEDGNILLTKEAGHSVSRILHANGDATGKRIIDFLLSICPFEIMQNQTVVDLLIKDDYCYGVTLQDVNGTCQNIYANKIVIASGGFGGLYAHSTNVEGVSGILHGLAVEKNLPLENTYLTQFHPTVYSNNSEIFLLSEALRGEGAFIVNEQNERFAFAYDKRGELAPRDVLARAIADYTKGSKKAYLSFDCFDKEYFAERFPNIKRKMAQFGYNLPQDKIPIYPAFHYSIGGIKCDMDARVCGMQNLFVAGEAASTGVHGANRLASNSLLEGLVFGELAAKADVNVKDNIEFAVPQYIAVNEDELKLQAAQILWDNVGIMRSRANLQNAVKQLDVLRKSAVSRTTQLELTAACEIANQALNAPSSIGAHFMQD